MPIDATYRPAILALPGYRVALDGWAAGMPGQEVETVKGVVDEQGTTWYLTQLDGWHDAPTPRTSLTARSGEHGGFDGPAYLDMRAITVEGIAIATDRVSTWRARDIVASICGDPSLGLSTLVITQAGHVTRRCQVRRSGDTKTRLLAPGVFRWSMVLVAPDPRRYADDLSTQAVGLPQTGAGGLVFPAVFPLTFGSGASGGQMQLTHHGTVAVWPTWLVLGPLSGPVIANTSTGEHLEFDPTFALADGETMTIDTDAKTVSVGGISRRDRLFVAQWFRLEPGVTSVRFSSASGSDPDASLTAQWRDGWV